MAKTNRRQRDSGHNVLSGLLWEAPRYCYGIIPDEPEYFLDDKSGKRIAC